MYETYKFDIVANLIRAYRMILHDAKLSTMTAVWLLPIVSTIVAAASGGIIAAVLPNPKHALWTLTVSYILWGIGVPLAMFTLVLYFQRLTMHNLPPREVMYVYSVFIFSLLNLMMSSETCLGSNVSRDVPQTHQTFSDKQF